MRTYVDGQVRRTDAIVDRGEARWRSEAATAYRKLHREAGADAVRVRRVPPVPFSPGAWLATLAVRLRA
ncbi:hypothetical protein STANM337S_00372 [Streptomyces tanashiensis]